MGLLNALADDKQKDVKTQMSAFYTGNKRLINGIAWSAFLVVCLKGSAVYMQSK